MGEAVIIAFFRIHRAGPRKDIYYEPEEVKAAIVTCGGLCPGLNDVIRQVLFFKHCSSDFVPSTLSLCCISLNSRRMYGAFTFV